MSYLVSKEAAFNAAGVARVEVGPTRFGSEWTVYLLSSVVTGSAGETKLNVYRNTESRSALIASSRRANNDQSTDDGITLKNLEKLIFVWTGGTPGAVATIVIEGDET